MAERVQTREFTDAHLFGAIGGGAMGFRKARARVGNIEARFRSLGSIDVDAKACKAFERNIGVPATCMDLFDREQYREWHGEDPPLGWKEATPEDIRRAFGGEAPDVGFLSAPCKGFSGLLPESSSLTPKYQALNKLTLRGIWLWLEAFKDQPTKLIFFENVPRIQTRGRYLLDQIVSLLRAYNYAVAETKHDCGELGGLAQSRKRFLLVARHVPQVDAFMYEPPKQRLKGVGEILDRMPLPGDPAGGPMHRMPALQWKTWVRLAFVRAGADWRSLNELVVEDGFLRDYVIVPETGAPVPVGDPTIEAELRHHGHMGVNRWGDTVGAISSRSGPSNGNYGIADPRHPGLWSNGQLGVKKWGETAPLITGARSPLQGGFSVSDPRVHNGHPKSVQLGVRKWDKAAPVIKGDVSVGTGPYAVSDPRLQGGPRFSNAYRIQPYNTPALAVSGPGGPGGGHVVADPRAPGGFGGRGKYRVTKRDEAAGTVISGSTTGQGAFAIADPIPTHGPNAHRNKLKVTPYDGSAGTVTGADRVGSGALSVADPRPHGLNKGARGVDATKAVMYVDHYGVMAWGETSKAVSGSADKDNGRWSVADPRQFEVEAPVGLPGPEDRLVCVIRALDDTWHRPFTTAELAALQSLINPDDIAAFHLEEAADSTRREWIGNAVPPDAAEAMGIVALETLVGAELGVRFKLSNTPIWVQDIAVAMSVKTEGQAWHAMEDAA